MTDAPNNSYPGSESAELARRIESHVKHLANTNMNLPLGTWGQIANDLLDAARALRTGGVAQPPKEHRWAIEDRENAERNARLQRERDAARASAQGCAKCGELEQLHGKEVQRSIALEIERDVLLVQLARSCDDTRFEDVDAGCARAVKAEAALAAAQRQPSRDDIAATIKKAWNYSWVNQTLALKAADAIIALYALSSTPAQAWQGVCTRPEIDHQPGRQFILIEGSREDSGVSWYRQFAGEAWIRKPGSEDEMLQYRKSDVLRICKDGDIDPHTAKVTHWMPGAYPFFPSSVSSTERGT